MNKTKLGMSVNMAAALVYLLALVNLFADGSFYMALPLVLLIAFILYKEENVWLKANALKAGFFVLFFIVISICLGFVNNFMTFLNFFLQFAGVTIVDGWGILDFIKNILNVIEKVFLLILTSAAFAGKNVKIPVVDNLITKHLQ